jgi:hypothetical protein
MSRHYHDADCAISAQVRTAVALERLADTLDDYMTMSLSLQSIGRTTIGDPQRALDAIGQTLALISEQRVNRTYTE